MPAQRRMCQTARGSECLVYTTPWDDTARAFQVLFEMKGNTLRRLFFSDIPYFSGITIRPLECRFLLISGADGNPYYAPSISDLKTFWYWRSGRASINRLSLHKEDIAFVKASFSALESSLLHYLESIFKLNGIMLINSFSSARKAESKILQINAAKHIGLNIPRTIITTDKKQAINFITSLSSHAIRKDFIPFAWHEKDHIYPNFTTRVSIADISGSTMFNASPHILQEEIDKRSDVRVVIIDEYVSAFEIHTNGERSHVRDWRAHDIKSEDISILRLPEEISNKLQILRKTLNLMTMSVDMVIDKKGDFWFLEINQAGQFLWIDELIEDSFLMEAFYMLLTEHRVSADWTPDASAVHFCDIITSHRFRELTDADHEHPILSYQDLLA